MHWLEWCFSGGFWKDNLIHRFQQWVAADVGLGRLQNSLRLLSPVRREKEKVSATAFTCTTFPLSVPTSYCICRIEQSIKYMWMEGSSGVSKRKRKETISRVLAPHPIHRSVSAWLGCLLLWIGLDGWMIIPDSKEIPVGEREWIQMDKRMEWMHLIIHHSVSHSFDCISASLQFNLWQNQNNRL